MWIRICAVTACLTLAACGGGGGGTSADASELAGQLKANIPTITKTVKITEDNDPNGDIGRPGKYKQAVSIYDSNSKCESALDVSCGAKIEVYSSSSDANARKKYVQDILKASPILGSEYDYVNGSALLRVSGKIKPSEARKYAAAFK